MSGTAKVISTDRKNVLSVILISSDSANHVLSGLTAKNGLQHFLAPGPEVRADARHSSISVVYSCSIYNPIMKPKRRNPKPLAKRSREQTATVKKVIRLEKLVWKVAQERDANAFRELVPADAIMIFQSGIMRQPDYLKTMKERTIAHYEFGPIRGFMPTDSTVILVYQAVRIGHEGNRNFPQATVVESTTWVKREGRWVAVLNQETPISK